MANPPTPAEWTAALQNPVQYKRVFSEIQSDGILECSEKELMKHAKALCVFHIDPTPQDQISASLFIHGLLLSRIAARFETVNEKTTKMFKTLTIIAVIAGVIQATAAIIGIWPKLVSLAEPSTPAHLSPTPQSQPVTTP